MSKNWIKDRSLFVLWERDQKIAFGLTLLLSRKCNLEQIAPLKILLDDTPVSILGDAVLHQIASLSDEDIDDLDYLGVAPSFHKQACAVLNDLRNCEGVNHQVLAAKGLTMLLESHLSLDRFTHWAERLSPDAPRGALKPHIWSKGLWQSLRDRATNNADARQRLVAAMSKLGQGDPSDGKRVTAICDWFDSVNELFASDGVPAALTRLGFGLLSAQFCWPIQIAEIAANKDQSIGIALPLFAWLKPRWQAIEKANRVWVYSGIAQYQRPSGAENHRFSQGCLQWNDEWHRAMRRGLEVGKDLWKSQNGRMVDPIQRDAMHEASLCVDFSIANRVVDTFPATPATPLVLKDRSAEAYWTQVVLGLLLPAQRIPLGTATGTVLNLRSREYVLGDVNGLETKLKFASRSGFLQKMVMPRTPKTAKAIEAAFQDDDATRTDLLESNLCATVRDAADALQASGWRRAVFLSTPETRYGFSQLTRYLFELDDAGVDLANNAPGPDRSIDLRRAWHRATQALDSIRSKKLGHGPSAVQFVAREVADDKELGYWLGSVDHKVRSGQESGFMGPGLGIACIRTRSGESDVRFWSHVFQLLEASDSHWEKFQFGTIEQSTEALVDLLNNFGADPAISSMPAPDLLVIVDEGGATQDRIRRSEVPGDVRGSLRELLRQHPPGQFIGPLLADRLVPRDEARSEVLGKTRIMVIKPPVNSQEAQYRWPTAPRKLGTKAQNTLDALRIFRSGFSIHQARAVIEVAFRKWDIEAPDWVAMRNELDALTKTKKICYGRGEFYFSESQRQRPVDPEIVFNADLHEAAALAFAPIIGGASSGGMRRGTTMTVHHLREAAWHFQHVYAFAGTMEQVNRARATLSLLGFVLPVQDWDTVRAMGYDKLRYGARCFDLACDLIKREAEGGSPPHAARFALAINAATQALAARKITLAKAKELVGWVQKFVAHHDELDNVAPEARTYLFAEQAFFLQRFHDKARKFGWHVPPDLWDKTTRDLKRLTDEHLSPAVQALLQNPAKYAERSSFPLQHGWLMNECDRALQHPRGADDAWRYVYAACATDLNASPDSWVRLLATFPSSTQVRDFLQVLHLWQYSVEDKIAFELRMAQGLQRKVANSDDEAADAFRAAVRTTIRWRDRGVVRQPQSQMAEQLANVFTRVAKRVLTSGKVPA